MFFPKTLPTSTSFASCISFPKKPCPQLRCFFQGDVVWTNRVCCLLPSWMKSWNVVASLVQRRCPRCLRCVIHRHLGAWWMTHETRLSDWQDSTIGDPALEILTWKFWEIGSCWVKILNLTDGNELQCNLIKSYCQSVSWKHQFFQVWVWFAWSQMIPESWVTPRP